MDNTCEFNWQSATLVKNAVVFYYIHVTLHTLKHLPCLHVALFCLFVMKCMLKLPYLNSLKRFTSQFSTFLRYLLSRKNQFAAASRASGLAAKWCWLHCGEAQDAVSVLSVFCVIPMCLWLHFKYFTWFVIATMHAWIQLAIALVYVLMCYYGNTASSIIGEI